MIIEKVKQYWDARPCNIRHSNLEIGTVEYFNAVETRKYFVEPHIPGFADFARWKGKKVLEIGCGIGTDAVNFARAGADYTGIELSKESLALAMKRFSVFGLNGNFFSGNAEDLSDIIPWQEFDLIYSFGVIHHSPRPGFIIDQAYKYLKPDGEFRLMLYAANSWKSCMINAGLDQPEAQFGCPIANTYTRTEAETLLEPFWVDDIVQTHIFPYNVEEYRKYNYVKEPWFAAMPDEVFAALESELGWHLLITATK